MKENNEEIRSRIKFSYEINQELKKLKENPYNNNNKKENKIQ